MFIPQVKVLQSDSNIWQGYVQPQPRRVLTSYGVPVHVVDEVDEAEDCHGDPLGRGDTTAWCRPLHSFTANWHKGRNWSRGIQTTVAVLHRWHQLLVRMVGRYSGGLHVKYFQRMPVDESLGRHWLQLSGEHNTNTPGATLTDRLALTLPPWSMRCLTLTTNGQAEAELWFVFASREVEQAATRARAPHGSGLPTKARAVRKSSRDLISLSILKSRCLLGHVRTWEQKTFFVTLMCC